ncbi:hypothetical protein LuPra_03269 [Luteitalea pratensis]|uniref:DUF2914 domain-containing protein n=1 Tax=Luteitalea pratensis TaxID=1855912 RepID=A0A143PNK5_LUTPR|nr:DUF5924 family protein [Luteitalea pratensis]AMY10041.1 hypothetical protein LuPra_03269 [Luteitalea pratensis]
METLDEPQEQAASRWSPRALWSGLGVWFAQHETKLWWLHSLWALAFGIGVMWLGARNFAYLRIALIHVAFIWITSMALPFIIRGGALSKPWRSRAQLLINYLNKNFYQQLLFFILPVYWLSTTPGSRNVLFVVLLATAALLSTMDLVYDRHVAMRRVLTALFFSFSVFAGAAAALPILWQIETAYALWLAAVVAAVGATTLIISERRIDWQRTWFAGGLIVLGLFLMVEYGRPFIPPTPLRIQYADFGTQMEMRDGPRITRKIGATPGDPRGQVYVVTAIYAPRGLHDRVRHVWYQGAQRLTRSRWYDLDGGRKEGYRLWTSLSLSPDLAGKPLHVDVETESGQLIGRAWLGAPHS